MSTLFTCRNRSPHTHTHGRKGGQTIRSLPAPLSTVLLASRRVSDGGSNQNLMLLIRGNAVSAAPSIKGTNQFPNPPVRIDITIKKIITKAWAVTKTL